MRKVNFDKELLDKSDNELKMEGTEIAIKGVEETMFEIAKTKVI